MKEYKEAYKIETFGSGVSVGIKILISIDRELNKNDGILLNKIVEELKGELIAETLRLSPEIAKSRDKEKAEIISIFRNPIFVEEIPNGYCSRYCCRQKPWFVITTPIGRIKIGWRKRVLQISWDETKVQDSAEELFPKEEVTKFDKTIHAWGIEKAKEYIAILEERVYSAQRGFHSVKLDEPDVTYPDGPS